MTDAQGCPLAVKRVNVLGAGVCGLSVALEIKERYGASVEVVVTAENLLEKTTSYVAGGLWEPYCVGETPEDLIRKWAGDTYRVYAKLFTSPVAAAAGIQQLNVFNTHSTIVAEPFWSDVPMNFHTLDAAQLAAMGIPSKYICAHSFTSYVAEPRYFLKYMIGRLEALGGVTFEEHKVETLTGYLEKRVGFDVVVNCMGLGSLQAVGDEDMYPARGQIMRVVAPWLKSSWTFNDKYYIIPNMDAVVIGGTNQKYDWNSEVSVEDSNDIMDGVCKVFPALRTALVESVAVGLRPCRSTVRLQSEVISHFIRPDPLLVTVFRVDSADEHMGSDINRLIVSADAAPTLTTPRVEVETSTLVVHCYGLGGCGFTIGPGLAKDLVENHIHHHLYPAEA